MVVMFDTLCRHFLPSYGNDWVSAPNFDPPSESHHSLIIFMLAQCLVPTRREMHTGRYNFLHRSWGPLEPFDDSMPAILDANGIHAHKVMTISTTGRMVEQPIINDLQLLICKRAGG